jgi:hypothetical protein
MLSRLFHTTKQFLTAGPNDSAFWRLMQNMAFVAAILALVLAVSVLF